MRSARANILARNHRAVCAWILLSLCSTALEGCAAYKATQQPDKKNLSVLTPGTPRSHVIAELGAPLWSEERDGNRVDLFAFRQGYRKSTKAGRALVHGAADVVTGGLWEVVGIPAESLADGRDVKVEVTYDRLRGVQKIEVIEGENVIRPRSLFSRKSKREPGPARQEAALAKRDAEAAKPQIDAAKPQIEVARQPSLETPE